jgi:hypothetical protein
MTTSEFSQRLLQTNPDSPEAAAVARDLVEDAHYPANLVLQDGLVSSDGAEQIKAKHVLAELGGLALAPLAGTSSGPELETELWVMRTMTEELVAFRRRAASVLNDLLSNRHRAAQLAEGSSSFLAGSRVCDLAFIMLHRLLHLESSPAAFLGLTHEDRDKQVKALQVSRAFQSALEGPK